MNPGPLAVALVALLAALTLGVSAAAAAVPTAAGSPQAVTAHAPEATKAAGYGAGWLAREIGATGGFVRRQPGVAASSADGVNTANAVLALHAAGVGSGAAERAVNWLRGHVDQTVVSSRADDAGKLATLILAAVAAGVDPARFGTAGNGDLLARLDQTKRRSGADRGLYGVQSPSYDGAFRQGLVLLAQAAAGRRDNDAIAWLRAQQCDGGGWTAYRRRGSGPCPPVDPAAFRGPDTNSTALALAGLRALGEVPARDAVAFLRGQQGDDGGFANFGGRTQRSDPNSTAVVIQALTAAGEDPAAGGWTRPGGTPYDRLSSFQLGCPAPEAARGALFFPGAESQPNLLATVQAVPALAAVTPPIRPGTLRAEEPVLPCAAGQAAVTGTANPAPAGQRDSGSGSTAPLVAAGLAVLAVGAAALAALRWRKRPRG